MNAKTLLLAVFLLALPIIAQAGTSPDTAAGILDFADSLQNSGESYRAVTEYLRALHHFGEDPLVKKRAILGLADSYAKANRYGEAADRLLELNREELAPDIKLALGEALYLAGRESEAAGLLLKPGASPEAVRLGTLSWLKLSSDKAPPDGADPKLIEDYKNLPRKSPATAGVLSALLPGAGHLYVDRPHDALMAFLLNGAFIWGTFEAAKEKQWGLTGLLGVAEVFWYSGTIVGSVNGAHKWNLRERDGFYNSKLKEMNLRWSAYAAPGGGGLVLSLAW